MQNKQRKRIWGEKLLYHEPEMNQSRDKKWERSEFRDLPSFMTAGPPGPGTGNDRGGEGRGVRRIPQALNKKEWNDPCLNFAGIFSRCLIARTIQIFCRIYCDSVRLRTGLLGLRQFSRGHMLWEFGNKSRLILFPFGRRLKKSLLWGFQTRGMNQYGDGAVVRRCYSICK